MTEDEFRIFRDLVHRECGISLHADKKDFLRAKIEKRLGALNIGSYFQYYKYLTEKNRDELCIFIDSVTINETHFFRNAPQFEMFREEVLPELLEGKRRRRDYRFNVWSAGCATGEEPYSIAMELAEAIPDALLWNIKIVASDISLRCLGLANSGRYDPEKLNELPEHYRGKFFKRVGEYYEVKSTIKNLVTFDYHNLQHENGLSEMDVIFCRNVMIYFDIVEQRRLVERFIRILNPGGYLFLGHAESLQGIMTNGDFKFHYWKKGAAYQRVNHAGKEPHG